MLCVALAALIGLMATQVVSQSSDCYEDCRCLTASKGIHCPAVPQVPRRTLLTDYLSISFCQERPFDSTALYRHNTTGLVSLERISMSRCGLEMVEAGAFSDMKNLTSLDLSQNQLRTIAPYTFRSISLETLYLGSNLQLQLNELSFAELKVQHLKLENNSLRTLDVDVFLSLRKVSLRSLTLHSNKVTFISPELKDFIQSLQRVELHNNPFVCDCSMKWFIDLYRMRRQQGNDLFGNVAKMELSCGAGPLSGRAFVNVSTANDLQCYQPVATDVRIEMTRDEWLLVCAFEGNPMPVVSIKEHNVVVANQFVRRNVSVSPQKRIEVRLPITGLDNITGAYRCEAHNEIGNASLAVDLSLPRVFYRELAFRNEADAAAGTRPTARTSTRRSASESAALRLSTVAQRYDKSVAATSVMDDDGAERCVSDKQFSVIELIIAVVITFVGSSLLSFIIFRVAQSESVGDFFKSARTHNYTLANGRYAHGGAAKLSYHDDAEMQQAAMTGTNYAAQNLVPQPSAVNGSVSSQSFRSLPNPSAIGTDGAVAQVHLAYRPQPPRPTRAQAPYAGLHPALTGYNTSMSINEFRHLNAVQ